MSDNPQKVGGLAGVTLGTLVQSIATLISGSIIGLVYTWKPALVGMACIPFVIWTGYIRLRVVVLKDQHDKGAHRSSAQLACKAAASIRTVASPHSGGRLSETIQGKSGRASQEFKQDDKVEQSVVCVLAISNFLRCCPRLLVWRTARLLHGNQYDGVFRVPDEHNIWGDATAIVELIDATPEIDAESTAGKIFEGENVRGQIRFENVHFRYPTRSGVRVLRDLSLKVEPGTYVALVGASGCGKSTVVQLIERFYDPLSGQILLDGQPINEFNVQEYRKQIALVSQEPTLYAGTVRFNILLGATKPESEVTQEEIEAACRDANILDFIRSLPDGFDTQVGSKGSQLSGGQKQRIAIARALLRNPKVLLLDEATSALDSNSEKVVQEALDQAAKGRTTIAIAHRLSTIQNADRIYFIKEGRVTEAGTHDELLSLRGDCYEYVQLQTLNKK
ncbi:P-loop containing nucleoside triphosphate hydrolase protein [Imleria badia]|nr:P-loop containing nucleoside triphosphate hydrolase protein [Imleria badia]